MEFAPIVLFAYNRPDYLKETLIALSNNREAKESDLYIYCDGPKANADRKNIALIEQVRQLAYSQKWCKNVYIQEAEINMGLSRSVIAGVTQVVNKYGTVIVLEDDIVVAPFFLKFMNEALKKFNDAEEVAAISGYNYPLGNLIKNKETFFLKAISCWGWATWKRSWSLYDDDAVKLLSKLQKEDREVEFNFGNTFRYSRMLKMTIEGDIDSWFIRWYASCFLQNKLTLYPTHSLVKNIGMIGTNIVGDNTDFLGNEYSEKIIENFDSPIAEDSCIRVKWQQHYKRYNRRRLNLNNIKYAISKIKMKYRL